MAAERLALQADGVDRARRPVEPEAAADAVVAIAGAATSGQGRAERILVEIARVEPVAELVAGEAAEPQAGGALIGAAAEARVEARGFRGFAGDHVDHAVDRVGPPQRR